ncbi:MAG: class I SAM-dependent methyltransferase, partial [Polyangiaceae bacterium]
ARFKKLATPRRFTGPKLFEPFRDELGLSSCRDCAFVFTNPRPSRALLDRFYGSLNQARGTADGARAGVATSEKSEFLLSYAERHAGGGRRLLEYGCAEGGFIRAAMFRGWSAVGFDVGEAHARCKALDLEVTDRLQSLEEGSFDVIVLRSVYEHLEERVGTLAGLKRLLVPGGKLVVEVPNAASLRARLAVPLFSERGRFADRYAAFPISLSFFTPETLARFVERAGFVVDELRTFGLGLDGLVFREEPPRTLPPLQDDKGEDISTVRPALKLKAARARELRRFGSTRDLLRDLFLKSGLGEHVVVAAGERPSAS